MTMLAERIDVVQRFSELFPGTFPFSCGPFRILYDDPTDYGIKYNGNIVALDGDTGCPRITASRRDMCNARNMVVRFGSAISEGCIDDIDQNLEKLHSALQDKINNYIIKLLMFSGSNRTNIRFGHPTCAWLHEMLKRYNITHLCVPENFDETINLPTYKFSGLNRVIGLVIPDLSKSPLIIYPKDFHIYNDSDINDISAYGVVQCSFVIYDSNCVYLSL